MRVRLSGLVVCMVLATPFCISAQSGSVGGRVNPASAPSPAQVYGRQLSNVEKEFVEAAEAMPEEKYGFAPTQGEFKGVRTFADQVKHVAEANYHYFAPLAGGSHSDADGIQKLTTKAEILKALKDSFVLAHKVADSTTLENAFIPAPSGGTRAGALTGGISHVMDHYGQLVVYLRMNGIVPPASRK